MATLSLLLSANNLILLTELLLSANNGRYSVFLSVVKCILPRSFTGLQKGSEINLVSSARMSEVQIHQENGLGSIPTLAVLLFCIFVLVHLRMQLERTQEKSQSYF